MMPNWCRNNVTITRIDTCQGEAQLAEFRRRLEAAATTSKDGKPELNLLSTFLPMPDMYRDTVEGTSRIAAEDDLTWYDWQLANWGVKWGDFRGRVLDSGDTALMYLEFETPWGPPTTGLCAISSRFPLLSIFDDWDEEGLSKGYIRIEAGRVTLDQEVTCWSQSAVKSR